jgi:hypothetical protein
MAASFCPACGAKLRSNHRCIELARVGDDRLLREDDGKAPLPEAVRISDGFWLLGRGGDQDVDCYSGPRRELGYPWALTFDADLQD